MSNPPGIAIEGDIEAGKQYIPQALQLLDNLKSYLSAGEIESGRSHLRLADDAYCYAIVAMGVSLVRIVVSPGVSSSVQFTATQFPDFLSGVVVKGLIIGDVTGQKRVLDSLFPTKECGRLHALRADTPNKIE